MRTLHFISWKRFGGIGLMLFANFGAYAQPKFKKLQITELALPVAERSTFARLQPGSIEPGPGESLIAVSCFVTGNSCVVVPLQLLDFTAVRADEEYASLLWTTAGESGITGYYVERTIDPRGTFISQGFVSSVPQAANNKYRFRDPNNLPVTSYYRLRIAHTDGSVTYSSVKAVPPVKQTTALTVFPNPATSIINVRVIVSTARAATIILRDAAGRKLDEWKANLFAGTNTFPKEINRLAGGVYYIQVISADAPTLITSFSK